MRIHTCAPGLRPRALFGRAGEGDNLTLARLGAHASVRNHALNLCTPIGTNGPIAQADTPVRPKLLDVEAELRFLRLLVVGGH